MAKPEQFIKKYHVAVARANKDQLAKIKPKIASDWVNEWMETVGGKITDRDEFTSKFQQFLTDELGFSDQATVTIDGDELVIDVGGCLICPGNDILKKSGGESLCPITATGMMAISRVMGKKATLEGVDKKGKPVGFCRIKYKLEEK
ncbi:MAG: hypothetical protein ACYC99_15915 [Candidatus Geothermincolia bacterium]